MFFSGPFELDDCLLLYARGKRRHRGHDDKPGWQFAYTPPRSWTCGVDTGHICSDAFENDRAPFRSELFFTQPKRIHEKIIASFPIRLRPLLLFPTRSILRVLALSSERPCESRPIRFVGS
jgi:hypothetical protein